MLPKLSIAQPVPDYKVLVNGTDITRTLRGRLISLTLADKRRFETDTVDIELDDSDGQLAFPPKGATMHVFIGWQGEALTDKGTFTIDEIEHNGPPDVLTLRGKAADMRDSMQVLHEQSYHDTNLGDILKTLAGRNGLTPKIAEALSAEAMPHIDQQNESDAAFLTRLAIQFDALATVKLNNLLFMPAGEAKTLSGTPLPGTTITRQSGDSHSVSVADRNAYTGVKAVWHSNDKAQLQVVKTIRKYKTNSGEETQRGSTEFIVGSEGNIKVLRTTYASRQSAERAAKAEWERLQRNVATFSITLAKGQPELTPETPVMVQGFKNEIDALPWLLTEVTHTINDNGYTTALQLEVKNSEIPDVEDEALA